MGQRFVLVPVGVRFTVRVVRPMPMPVMLVMNMGMGVGVLGVGVRVLMMLGHVTRRAEMSKGQHEQREAYAVAQQSNDPRCGDSARGWEDTTCRKAEQD